MKFGMCMKIAEVFFILTLI